MDKQKCHVCNTTADTMYRKLSSGHIGRLCSNCNACRLGKPYASKREYSERGAK